MNTTTPPVRVSFPTLFTPRAVVLGQDPKYGIVLMFDKTNAEHKDCLRKLLADAQEVFNEKWPDPEKAPRIPLVGHDKSPIKDGDKACDQQGVLLKEKNPEYAGHFIVRAGSLRRPVVVDRGKAEVLDSNVVYGGCYCKANINPYPFDKPTNKGVTFGLNGVQFWKDGGSFGGGRPALDDMFESDSGQNDAANYSGDNDDFFGGEGQGADDVPF